MTLSEDSTYEQVEAPLEYKEETHYAKIFTQHDAAVSDLDNGKDGSTIVDSQDDTDSCGVQGADGLSHSEERITLKVTLPQVGVSPYQSAKSSTTNGKVARFSDGVDQELNNSKKSIKRKGTPYPSNEGSFAQSESDRQDTPFPSEQSLTCDVGRRDEYYASREASKQGVNSPRATSESIKLGDKLATIDMAEEDTDNESVLFDDQFDSDKDILGFLIDDCGINANKTTLQKNVRKMTELCIDK